MNNTAQQFEIFELLVHGESESCIPADSSFWIPYSSTSPTTEFDFDKIEGREIALSGIELNFITSISCLKLTFLQIILALETLDSITLVSNLWSNETESVRKRNLIRTAELIFYLRTVLQTSTSANDICTSVFDQPYHQLIAKTDLFKEMLLRSISTLKSNINHVPKWKGKSMQFIELISIGIELGLFDGPNQNEICNSLLKAFQVEAESDQPIYKQRFNALFKRSKVHLPLIANYINKVEEMKGMKIVLNQNEW